MGLQDRLAGEIKAAMLAKDAERLSTLRLLKSAVGYVQIERKTETLSDAEFVGVVQKEVKKRRDSIEQFEKAGRTEELSQLLASQLDSAKDREDIASIVSLSMRLGALLEQRRDEHAALDVYHAVLDWEPQSKAALRAIARIIVGRGEADAIEEAYERLLAVEEGSEAVRNTIQGIEEIRSSTGQAREVLERLVLRIGEIGEILTVIREINDETNLLSLNAAIIAAQAGEQGKAFAVVANHVKTLAQRTAGSTKEIEGLIRAVQDESSNAVRAMAAGMEAVESGVQRSRKAGEELERIRSSSREASVRVAEIARAAGEQGRNSKHVAEAAQNTSSMVQQISTAMSEQSRASDAMLKNAEAALELCRQVHRSTEEQRESGRFITASIGSITEMIRSIQQNTESHSAASEAVSDAVSRILEVARKAGERVPEVLRAVEELREHSGALADAAGTGSARAAGFLS